jgi:hypothetical protein
VSPDVPVVLTLTIMLDPDLGVLRRRTEDMIIDVALQLWRERETALEAT